MGRGTSRLHLLAAVTAAATLAGGLLAAPATAQSVPPGGGKGGTPRSEPALAAGAFVDRVGVDTHFRYTDGAYANAGALVDAISRLGVRHIRDGFPLDPTPELLDALGRLPAQGIKAQFVLGSPDLKKGAPLPSGADALAAVDAAHLSGLVESFESPNEWDLKSGSPDYVAQLQRFVGEVHAGLRTDPAYSTVPLVGPSVGRKPHVAELTGFADIIDINNLHNYAAGGTPEDGLQGELSRARAVAPGKPLYVTETGYHTAANATGGQKPVSDQAKADYLTRTLLENVKAGVDRTYIYQLVDNKDDPGGTDQEQHFGLLRSDLAETPAYAAVHDLLAAVADPGPAYATTPLPVSVDGGGPDVQHLLLQKRDGSYALALWRRGQIYAGGHDVAGSSPVTVRLGGVARSVSLQAVGTAPQTLGTAATVQGELGNAPVVLQLGAAAGTAAGVARFDTSTPAGRATPTAGGEPASSAGRVPLLVGGGAALLVLGLVGGLLLGRRRRRPGPGAPPSADTREPVGQSPGGGAGTSS